MTDIIQGTAYDLWIQARHNIYEQWTYETDPANLQTRVRTLNRRVADFIRENISAEIDQQQVNKALDIVEAPWAARDEGRLRKWFGEELDNREKSKFLIKMIIESGLEPFVAPEPLPQ